MKSALQILKITIRRFIIISLPSLLYPVLIVAQSTTLFNFEEVLIEAKGERFNTFFSIVQDQEGFLWFGTNNGLIKYDGYESKVYKNVENDSTTIGGERVLDLGDNPILLLYVDSQGVLWAGTTNDLSRYDKNCDCFSHYQLPVAKGRINAITEDKDNNLWVGGQGEGLYKYNRDSDQFIPYLNDPENPNSINKDFVNTLLTDDHNNIWIGLWNNDNETGGLIRYNPSTGIVKRFQNIINNINSLKDNRISSILEDQDGNIWVGTLQNGLHQYNAKTEEFIRIMPNPNKPDYLQPISPTKKNDVSSWAVNILHQNQNSNFWVGSVDMGLNPDDPIMTQIVDETVYHITGMGINHYEPLKEKLNSYNLSEIKKVPTTLFEDRQGQLWLGFQRSGGLYKLDNYARKFKKYPELKGIQRSCESQVNPGKFWISTLNDGLHRLETESDSITTYLNDKEDENSIGHNSVRATYEDEDGILWLGLGTGGNYGGENGDGGLDRYDPKTGIFKHFNVPRDNSSNFSLTIYGIAKGDGDFLWMDTGRETILRFDKRQESFKEYNLPSATKGSKVWIIGENSVEFFGAVDFTHGILYKYNLESDRFISFLDECHSNALAKDGKGAFWNATWGEGLIYYNPEDGSTENFTTKDGLINDLVAGIIAGDSGIYWLATRVGLTRFDSKTKEFTSAGLPQDHFHIMNIKARDGQFLFGGNNALYAFYPEEVQGNPFAPIVLISGFQINGQPYNFKEANTNNISLSYNQNDISIEYKGIHNSNPSKNRYQYKLIPYDNDWIDADYQRAARYASLEPGDYTFLVKASNSDGVWSTEDVSISFIITPPWWQRWWAITIMALLTTGILIALFRFQLSRKLSHQEANRLKELDIFKTRFYANITHEFRTPLTVIEGMANELEKNPEKAPTKNLALIKKNSKSLLVLVNQMLDLSKLQARKVDVEMDQVDILQFLKYFVENYESIANLKNIGLQFYSNEHEIWIDTDTKKLEQILTNLISNALKFTPQYGKVLVTAKTIKLKNNFRLELLVKDNGIGISPEQLPFIFDRFHQANPTHANQGTGIGLTLVKELVTIMDGSITVESELNKGTTVTLNFPISNRAAIKTETDYHSIEPIFARENTFDLELHESNDNLPVLLIIEDNKDVTYYLQICLENRYQIVSALNGKKGIEIALEEIPDIIISDVMMPEMDGFEVCEILKKDERSSHIPIILLTAKATIEDKLIGLNFGADAYLTKPFEKAELLIRLENLLEIRKTLQKKYTNALVSSQKDNKIIVNKEDSFIEKVECVILKNLDDEDFSVHDLAYNIHLSRSQLHRKIKALTGMSTTIYIRHIRLQKAKELLAFTELSVSEIAYQTGFKTPVYFSQIFKEVFGMSPSATRK